jgi:bifunctional DNA-binding transcriptional regulator/antitoxin component of YhaV-PrlF toxin-antitoxin module
MKIIPISRSGQIALPTSVRRRWGTRRVKLVDNGGELIVSPVPDDPVAAAAGALAAWRTPGTDEIRRQARREEREREERRDGTRESRP